MRNILIIMPSMKMGGAEKSLLSLLQTLSPERLKENNLKIDLLVANQNGELMNQIPKYVNLVETPLDLENYTTQIRESIRNRKISLFGILQKLLWAILKKLHQKKNDMSENELYWYCMGRRLKKFPRSYDVVLAYMDGTASYYAIDNVHANRKVIWVHNELEKLKINREFQKHFYGKADCIITISDLCADSIKNVFSEYSNKVRVLQNISSKNKIMELSDIFYPEEYANVGGDCIKILSIGRLFYQKGFDIGIEAAKLLKERGYRFVWFIMGTGELYESLQNTINKYRLNSCIKLIGTKDNPYPYIRNCDVFFQPSRYEGKSIVVDEAKLLLKPIVVSNYNTVGASIVHEKTGLICELNPEGLMEGLKRMIDDKRLASNIIVNLETENNGNEQEIEKYLNLMKWEGLH